MEYSSLVNYKIILFMLAHYISGILTYTSHPRNITPETLFQLLYKTIWNYIQICNLMISIRKQQKHLKPASIEVLPGFIAIIAATALKVSYPTIVHVNLKNSADLSERIKFPHARSKKKPIFFLFKKKTTTRRRRRKRARPLFSWRYWKLVKKSLKRIKKFAKSAKQTRGLNIICLIKYKNSCTPRIKKYKKKLRSSKRRKQQSALWRTSFTCENSKINKNLQTRSLKLYELQKYIMCLRTRRKIPNIRRMRSKKLSYHAHFTKIQAANSKMHRAVRRKLLLNPLYRGVLDKVWTPTIFNTKPEIKILNIEHRAGTIGYRLQDNFKETSSTLPRIIPIRTRKFKGKRSPGWIFSKLNLTKFILKETFNLLTPLNGSSPVCFNLVLINMNFIKFNTSSRLFKYHTGAKLPINAIVYGTKLQTNNFINLSFTRGLGRNISVNNYTPLFYFDKLNNKTTLVRNYVINLYLFKLGRYKTFFLFCLITFLETFTKKKFWILVDSRDSISHVWKNYIVTNTALNFALYKRFKRLISIWELIEVIIIMLRTRDLQIFLYFIKRSLENAHFKKHKKILSILFDIFRKNQRLMNLYNIKGFFFDIRGKVGVSGNAKKRHLVFTLGKITTTTQNIKSGWQQISVWTPTGQMGITCYLLY